MVLEFAVATREPRPVAEAEAMVTAGLPMLTTPVKSSMRSNWPEARLEFARGRVKALRTLLLLKFTARLAPEIDTALAKFRSMPTPVTEFCETVKDKLATGLLEAATLSGQM